MSKTISDVIRCPKCQSYDCYLYNDDEVQFEYDGTGHYRFDCRCMYCGREFRANMNFTYEVIDDEV